MGWINRSKLNSLPIVNDTNLHPRLADGTEIDMIRTTMATLGGLGNPSKIIKIEEKLKKYSDTELRKKFSKMLLSLAQADAYLIDDKIHDKDPTIRSICGKSEWILCKNILVKFYITPGLLFVRIARKFIVRTGPDVWIAYDIPSLVFFDLFDDENKASE
jgi:hypothetical protein